MLEKPLIEHDRSDPSDSSHPPAGQTNEKSMTTTSEPLTPGSFSALRVKAEHLSTLI